MYSTILVSNWFQVLFSPDDQWRLLNKLNLVNALACLVLFSVARPICMKNIAASVCDIRRRHCTDHRAHFAAPEDLCCCCRFPSF